MTRIRARFTLAFILALAASSAALAQPGPMLEADAILADGREARAFTFGDGLGYRLDVDGAPFPVNAEGRPFEALLSDIDGDDADDLVLRIDEGAAYAPRTAHVWDVTLDQPYLMHVSEEVFGPESPIEQLQREVRGRFAVGNGLAAIGYLRDAADLPPEAGWETRNLATPNHLNTLEGVLVHADVALRRAELAAATDDGNAEAMRDATDALREAMERRETFARKRSSLVYD